MKKFLLMCFSFGFAISVWAQDRVVTGKLTSKEDGSSLPGVNVVVKGTTTGTVTDTNGAFSLSVPSSAILTFSFIGLKTIDVEVGDRTVVDVTLESDIAQLGEVVVTAVGIQKRRVHWGTQWSLSILINCSRFLSPILFVACKEKFLVLILLVPAVWPVALLALPFVVTTLS